MSFKIRCKYQSKNPDYLNNQTANPHEHELNENTFRKSQTNPLFLSFPNPFSIPLFPKQIHTQSVNK